MAIPENHSNISTNLPHSRLETVLKALEVGDIAEVPHSYMMHVHVGTWEVEFGLAKYQVSEITELLNSVRLISATPAFTQRLIDELESELALLVEKRDFDSAKEINCRIQSLSDKIN